MSFLDVMRARGLVAQITHEDEFAAHLKQSPRTAYIGFDPTAPSLHVGHLLQIMTLRRWQQAGHKVIAVVGGGTALIGDPSGKTDMRQMLTLDAIRQNMVGIKAQLAKFLDMSPSRGIIVNNYDWLSPLNYLELLREVGPHMSVNRMIAAECFKQRMEKGLSFLEFNYMILQSYDFLHLYRTHGCTVQMGGDDQWSNILSGMELVRRLGVEKPVAMEKALNAEPRAAKAFCVTTPLLTTADGKKMGKTEKGAVWLDPHLTSPYEYFQFWRNVDDAVVERCLMFFTEMPEAEVKSLAAMTGAAINDAKVVLAYEATKMLHGEAEAAKAREAAKALFAGGAGGGADAPEVTITNEQYGAGNVLDVLVAAGVAPSKAEGRRLVQQGGLVLDGEKVEDIAYIVPKTRLEGPEGCLVKKGKKHYYRLRISG
jgi:tyrosyl-tRNA synthetase